MRALMFLTKVGDNYNFEMAHPALPQDEENRRSLTSVGFNPPSMWVGGNRGTTFSHSCRVETLLDLTGIGAC